jgi:chromate transporter
LTIASAEFRTRYLFLNNNTTIGKLFLSFFRLGLTAFGGPAMVAYIKEMSVNRYKWLDEDTFKDGVALCQSVPGATAMQTAAYVGFRSKGIPGALASFVGFGLPACILMLFLSSLYAEYHAVAKIVSLFNGLQVIVVAIVAHATYLFGKNTFKDFGAVIAAISASALLWAGVSPFLVILGAALAGIMFLKNTNGIPLPDQNRRKDGHFAKHFSLLLVLLFSGMFALHFLDKKIFNLAALMMKIDLFAFGGGFASLPLMLHEIVEIRRWMDYTTFMNGIALGQVTPGPIVITSTFVGYMISGTAGALVSTVAVFTPSFLMVIAVTPVLDKLKASAYFAKATRGILASFVGLLFFVAMKFTFAVPWDSIRVLLACAALIALFKKVDILYLVLVTSAVSLFLF